MIKIETIEDLANLVGKVVVFEKQIGEYESFAEENMKARVVKYIFDKYEDIDDDPVHVVWFDFGEFDAENNKYFQANYYDKVGEACLTAKEAGFYQPVDNIYFMEEIPAKVVDQ